LLISVAEDSVNAVQNLLIENGYEGFEKPIGKMVSLTDKVIVVK